MLKTEKRNSENVREQINSFETEYSIMKTQKTRKQTSLAHENKHHVAKQRREENTVQTEVKHNAKYTGFKMNARINVPMNARISLPMNARISTRRARKLEKSARKKI